MYLFYDSDVKFAHRDLVVNGHFVKFIPTQWIFDWKKKKVGKKMCDKSENFLLQRTCFGFTVKLFWLNFSFKNGSISNLII